jgi:hypothetical protein
MPESVAKLAAAAAVAAAASAVVYAYARMPSSHLRHASDDEVQDAAEQAAHKAAQRAVEERSDDDDEGSSASERSERVNRSLLEMFVASIVSRMQYDTSSGSATLSRSWRGFRVSFA